MTFKLMHLGSIEIHISLEKLRFPLRSAKLDYPLIHLLFFALFRPCPIKFFHITGNFCQGKIKGITLEIHDRQRKDAPHTLALQK